MMKLDKDALECDLAETYHIYEMHELPLKKVALFSYGLRENSRIKLKMNEMDYPLDTILMAGIFDKLSILLWHMNNGESEMPEMILSQLLGTPKHSNKEFETFESGEDFERRRQMLLEQIKEESLCQVVQR